MTPITDTICSQNTITVTKQNEIECDKSGASGPFCNETAPTEVHGCSNLLALKHSEQVLNDDEIVAVEASIAKVLSENIETGFLENEPLFRLAQYWRGILNPEKVAPEILEPYVQMFFDNHSGLYGVFEFPDVMMLFEDIWVKDKVKYPNRDTIGIAVSRAKNLPECRTKKQEKMSTNLRMIDNVLFELQKIKGDTPIHLSQYQAAEIAGVSDSMGRKMLDRLERMGILKRVATGTPGGVLANSYFYVNFEDISEQPASGFDKLKNLLAWKSDEILPQNVVPI